VLKGQRTQKINLLATGIDTLRNSLDSPPGITYSGGLNHNFNVEVLTI